MAPKKLNPKQRLAKYLKRYSKTQETLRKIKFSKAFKAMPFKDYLSDEKFKESLTTHQQQSLRTLDAAERKTMLKIDVRQLASNARDEQLESKEFSEYKARLVSDIVEAGHKATTEYFEDRSKVDDLTLISMDTAYYLALAESGVDPCCFIDLQ